MRTRRMVGMCGLAALALLVPPTPAAAGGTTARANVGAGIQVAPPINWLAGAVLGVQGVAVSPNGQLVATAAQDDTVKLWRTSDGAMLRTLTGHIGHVSSVAFTPDGQFLASGGEFVFGANTTSAKLWRVSDGAFVGDFPVPQSAQVFSVAVSPDGTMLAGGLANAAQGGQINLWRISNRTLIRTLAGHPDASVFSVAFSPNGQQLASGGADNTVRIWQVSNGTRLRTLTGHTFFVSSVAYSPDGTTLASGSWDSTIRLWRVPNYTLVRTLRGHTDAVYTVGFSADSQTLASGSQDETVRLWRPSTGATIRTLPVAFVSSLTFSGSATLITGGFDSHVRVFRVSDGMRLTTMGKHTGGITSVAFSPDSALFASASADLTARVWRASDGADRQTFAEHTTLINAVAFAPDSQTVATASAAPQPGTPGPIKIWNVNSSNSVLTITGHLNGTTGVAFSADGSTVISSGVDNTLRFWSAAGGALLRSTNSNRPTGVLAVSPKRDVIAVEGFGTKLLLFDAAVPNGGLPKFSIQLPASASSLSFSGDGSLLAVGEEAFGNNVQIFRVSDGSLVRTLAGDPDGFVQGVAFAPTGSTVVSGSGFSRSIQVWNSATGALLTTYDRETGWGQSPQLPIAFSPSGTQFGFGRTDGPVVMVRNDF